MIARRALLTGLIGFVAAKPAIVRYASIMAINDPGHSHLFAPIGFCSFGGNFLTIEDVLRAKMMMEAAKLPPYYSERYVAITALPKIRRAARHARAPIRGA